MGVGLNAAWYRKRKGLSNLVLSPAFLLQRASFAQDSSDLGWA
jgi:hypothetical protein